MTARYNSQPQPNMGKNEPIFDPSCIRCNSSELDVITPVHTKYAKFGQYSTVISCFSCFVRRDRLTLIHTISTIHGFHINELAWKSVARGDRYESPYLAKATPFMESQKGQFSRLLISTQETHTLCVFDQLPVVSWRRAKYKQMYGLKSTLTVSR